MSLVEFRRFLETDFRSNTTFRPLSPAAAGDYVSRLRTLSRISDEPIDGASEEALGSVLDRLTNDSNLRARLNAYNSKAVGDMRVALRAYQAFLRVGIRSTLTSTTASGQPASDRSHVVQIVEQMERAGFTREAPTKRLHILRRGPVTIYVKRITNSMPIVVHPDFEAHFSRIVAISGVRGRRTFAWYHDSGMRRFPRRLNNGRDPIPYGIEFDARGPSIRIFAELIVELDEGEAGLGWEDEAASDPEETERQQLSRARLGQGRFRSDLMDDWKGCPLSGITRPDLLRASHIKPWRVSSHRERLDPNNGLLLAVHLDCLFDKGLISFDDDGGLLVAKALSPQEQASLGLHGVKPSIPLRDGNRSYLDHHRKHVFLDAVHLDGEA